MKKKLALVLSVVMVFSLLAACGPKEPTGSKDPSQPNSPSSEASHIKLEMVTLSIVPSVEATKVVENDINKYLKETLGETGYVLDLSIVSIADWFTTVPMELAGGQGPDVVMVIGQLPNFVSSGYLKPLDEFMDNELKPTADLIGNIMNSGRISGSFYMVPRYFGTVLDWKFIYNKEMVEGVYDMSKVHSINDLDDCLAALKVAYPNEHFLVYNDQFHNIFSYMTNTNVVGDYAATVGESTTLMNYYETDAFKQALAKSYDYRQKGYSDPEGSANTLSHDAVVMSGSSKGVIMGHSGDCEGIASMFTKNNTYGAEFGAVTIEIGDLYTDTLGIGISYTCKDPSAAARFINLLYVDDFVWKALIYGSEGQDYVWNADHTLVNYPEGTDFNTIPYNCMYTCGMIGNGFQSLPFENDTNTGSNSEYGMKLMQEAWEPPLYGFTPDPSNVFNEVAAVSNVVDQYLNPLIYGDVNPDDLYPEFISALKGAGIDNIIADYQAQANEYLAQNK